MSSRDRNTFNEINITPLTDIFLVLLIIMMVIAPLLDQQGLNLAVPNNVEVQDVKQDNKLISVTVSDDDRYYIDDSEVAVSQLESVIKQKLKTLPEGVLILTQPEASHGAVVKLMDKAKDAGVTNISISES
ncbi:MAG: biopolymer transporter ExbD [Candidatus Gastranaerophilaceae bacterium]|jgi:exbD/tolR family protein|nr:biopolymer transporter ExbD [Clostridium sp.]